jgi:hypothetical protein
VFPGLARQDEVAAGLIDHAIRFTANRTDRTYLWPARHQAGAANDANLPPMGARFRLKSTFSQAGFRPDTQVFLTAFKKYGMFLADNGSDWFFTGAAEPGWNSDLLDELKTIPASAFEAIDESSLMVDPNSAQFRTTTPPPPGPTIVVRDFAFDPASPSITRGARVTWRFDGPSSHTATDATGMTLYNSGSRAAGTTFAFTFTSAGRYPYRCTIHSGMTGTISVPITASPSSGTTATTFTLTWSSAPPPAAFVYDVQVRRPGSNAFVAWKTGVTAASSTFAPDAGPGTYRFRSRVRRVSNGKASTWAVAAVITVS